jgi:phenolic acid decarboxylase
MKLVFAIVTLCWVSQLTGCTSAASSPKAQATFPDIAPPAPLGLGGYANQDMSRSVYFFDGGYIVLHITWHYEAGRYTLIRPSTVSYELYPAAEGNNRGEIVVSLSSSGTTQVEVINTNGRGTTDTTFSVTQIMTDDASLKGDIVGRWVLDDQPDVTVTFADNHHMTMTTVNEAHDFWYRYGVNSLEWNDGPPLSEQRWQVLTLGRIMFTFGVPHGGGTATNKWTRIH